LNNTRIEKMLAELARVCKPLGEVQIMEVCGTHTVSLFRTGVKSLLPTNVKLVSGPGCPVCVTSQGYIDAACALAQRPEVIIATYGDMVRVPGSAGSLADRRAGGAEVAVVYSTRDALALARQNPDSKVVFLAVGFETTTPPTAAAVLEAGRAGLENFFILAGHKLGIPAMEILLSSGDVPIDGFLCPGHVSVIIGSEAYRPIVERFDKPCVVAGFEAENMVEAILHICRQVADGRAEVENVYGTAVTADGNVAARTITEKVFTPGAALWRAMGELPASGLDLRDEYKSFDALEHFEISIGPDVCPPGCLCGEVIQGKADPADCPLFAKTCTPMEPVGPCMVSSEGTCAAWYKYDRRAG